MLAAASGISSANVVTVMWAFVAYNAITGNIRAIATTAKWVLILQIATGLILAFTATGPGHPSSLGLDWFVAIGIGAAIWATLFYWADGVASSKERASAPPQSTVKHSATPTIQRADETHAGDISAGPAGSQTEYEQVAVGSTKNTTTIDLSAAAEDVSQDIQMIRKYRPEVDALIRGYKKIASDELLSVAHNVIASNPTATVKQLEADIQAKYEADFRPFDSNDANDALDRLRVVGPDAAEEFIRAYSLMGDTMNIGDAEEKIHQQFSDRKLNPLLRKVHAYANSGDAHAALRILQHEFGYGHYFNRHLEKDKGAGTLSTFDGRTLQFDDTAHLIRRIVAELPILQSHLDGGGKISTDWGGR